MDVKNNPVGRLHDLLHSARQHSDDIRAGKVWAMIFGLEEGDTGGVLRMLSDLLDLTHQAKAALQRQSDLDQEIYLQPFGSIERFFSQINLEAPWRHFKGHLSDTTLYGLQFGADRLARASEYTSIADDKLAELRREVDELVQLAMDADLPTNLRSLFMRNLEALQHALIAYRIRGIDGLREETERSIGSIVLHAEDIQSAIKGDGKLWKKYFEVLGHFNQTVKFAQNAKELAEPIIPLLANLLR